MWTNVAESEADRCMHKGFQTLESEGIVTCEDVFCEHLPKYSLVKILMYVDKS